MIALAILLLVLAVLLGFTVHPLLFLVVLLAIAVALAGRSRVP